MKITPIAQSFAAYGQRPFDKCAPKDFAVNSLTQTPIEKNALEYRESYFAQNNIPFGSFKCSTSEFDIRNTSGFDCPCCGKPMLTNKEQQSFVDYVGDKKGKALQKALSAGYGYYRHTEELVADILISTSKKHPEADLKELVMNNSAKSLTMLEKSQIKTINQMRDFAQKNLNKEQRTNVSELLDESIDVIKESNDTRYFRRKTFIRKMDELAKQYPDCKQQYGKLIDMADRMPSSTTDVDAFFVKYSKRKRQDNSFIAQRLISTASSTTEHIKPKNPQIGGENKSGNYIPLCAKCNSTRSSIPYGEWIQEHPYMVEGLQKYINQVDKMIKNREFQNADKYDEYVDEVIETFKQETDGRLILKKPIDDGTYAPENLRPEFLSDTKRDKPWETASPTMEDYEQALAKVSKLREENKELSFQVKKLKGAYLRAKALHNRCPDTNKKLKTAYKCNMQEAKETYMRKKVELVHVQKEYSRWKQKQCQMAFDLQIKL